MPKKGLRIAHINISSLRNKLIEINEILSDNVHILAVSETHLDATFDDAGLMLQGYNIFRNDRNAFGGGVAFYIQDHIPVKVRYDLMPEEIEILWVQIHLPHLKPMLMGCCYRPPDAKIAYLDKMCEMLHKACEFHNEIYFMGDNNINWLEHNCPLKKRLLDTADLCGLSQVIKKSTRPKSSKCLDHMFTNATEHCSESISVPMGCSDHNLIAIVRRTKVPKSGPKIIYKRCYKRFNEIEFVQSVNRESWVNVLEETDPNKALINFDELFMSIADRHAPIRKFTVRNVRTPWLDDEMKEYMVQRDEAKLAASRSGIKSDWQVYCKLRNFVTKLNLRKKKQYYEKRIYEINNDSRKMWNTLNNLMGKSTKPTPSFLEINGQFLTKPAEIANHLNTYFIDKVGNLRKGMPNLSNERSYLLIKNKIMKGKTCLFDFHQVETSEIVKILLSCKDKPSGTDNLDSKLLKMTAHAISPAVGHIINTCLQENMFPQKWKTAKIIPLPKNAKLSFSAANSRPISLLPALSKVMEKNMCNQINSYFTENNLTTDCQHAYKTGHSTSAALTQMTDDWLNEMDQKKMVGAVAIDFTAAFDLIDHAMLIKKLECYGFSSSALLFVESYLSNRNQTVFFNGSYSQAHSVECGVPQGSCLGPLLYTIFTNDLPQVLQNSNICMYADDSTIYTSAKTVNELNKVLSADLQSVVEWIKRNKLVINVSKTNSILFGTKHALEAKPVLNVCVDNVGIAHVQETKLLGIVLDGTLSWSTQISKLAAKMGHGISIVRRCTQFLTPNATKQILQAIVLSHLDYCPAVWSNAAMVRLNPLQILQNKAARIALGCNPRTHVTDMHVCLNWLTVKERLTYSLIVGLRNVIFTRNLPILCHKLTFSSNTHNYSTRHAVGGNFTLPTVKSEVGRRTVLYRAMVEWNLLPSYITQESSKTRFKSLLREHVSNGA